MSVVPPTKKTGPANSLRIKRPGERRNISRSATRALDVLEHFGQQRRPLRAFEIARMLATHPSTTDQLLKTMVNSAYLLFDAKTKTYSPTPRLIGFGNWLIECYGPDERLRDLVRDVQARTGFVCTLTTPNDLFMQVIEMADPAGWQTERGMQVSVFGSVIGSAYLSLLDDASVERLAYRARVAPADMPAIWDAISTIRAAGFADGATPGGAIWSLATALPSLDVRVPMVLGLAGPDAQVRLRLPELKSVMREAVASRIKPTPGDQ